VHGENLLFCAATIGNPHCVIPQQEISAERARRIGPAVEIHPLFPNRTNVQLMQVLDRGNIRIEIWERGAGYTLASGSSSCAAAAVAYKLGRCDESITVHMPGGRLEIELSPEYAVSMTGPVTRICAGNIDNEMFL
jgi:diaminopimelate epimerase